MNYNLEMKKQLESIEEGSQLLLHACCAPCSSAVLEQLGNFFQITILYYNPNISNENEYNKRLAEIKRFIKEFPTKYQIRLLEGRYLPQEFFDIAKGLEKEKERGMRCYKCYALRLKETAQIAQQAGYKYFTTTLSISPYKNSNWINQIGKDLEKVYNSTFIYSDFKKNNGYKRSIELSNEYNLYRQNYCGCIYSKIEREKKSRSN